MYELLSAMDMRLEDQSWFRLTAVSLSTNNLRQVVHTSALVTKRLKSSVPQLMIKR